MARVKVAAVHSLAIQIDQCQHLALTGDLDAVCELIESVQDVLADKLITFTDVFQDEHADAAALSVAVADVMSQATSLAILNLGVSYRLAQAITGN